jgi:hypothetical protein
MADFVCEPVGNLRGDGKERDCFTGQGNDRIWLPAAEVNHSGREPTRASFVRQTSPITQFVADKRHHLIFKEGNYDPPRLPSWQCLTIVINNLDVVEPRTGMKIPLYALDTDA